MTCSYLEQAAERFSEQRAENLRQIAALQLQLSERYIEEKSPVEDLDEEDDEDGSSGPFWQFRVSSCEFSHIQHPGF